MMRRLSALSWIVLSWLLLATAAGAQDGLERFERAVKPQIELDGLTYAGARALGERGFELLGVVAVMPARPAIGVEASTVRIDKVTVEALDFDRIEAGNDEDLPRFARIRLEGMSGDDELFTALTPYGVPQVPVDLLLDYRLDGKSKVFHLNALDITLRGQARLALSLVIDGVSDKASALEDSKDEGRLRRAALVIEDGGLMARLLPSLAREQGGTPQDLVTMVLAAIADLADGQGQATLKALDAVASFVADWEAPKGPLSISLSPAGEAGLSDLDKLAEPDALVEVFGLSVNYAGARSGAAKAPDESTKK